MPRDQALKHRHRKERSEAREIAEISSLTQINVRLKNGKNAEIKHL